MKRLYIAILLALGLCVNVLGMNYLGPPTTRLRQGQWYVGASYADSEQDLELENTPDIPFDDFSIRSILGRVGVGVATDRFEVFGLMGGAKADRDYFDTGDELAAGGGFRATLYLDKANNLDWGVVGQLVYVKAEGTGTVVSTDTNFDLSLSDIQFGIGPCWRPGPWMLYGGAMIHAIDGDLDTDLAGSYDVKAESWFGLYLGGGVDLADHWTLTAEAQVNPDAFAWGAGVQLRF